MPDTKQITFPDTRPEALGLPYQASVDMRTGNVGIQIGIPLTSGRNSFQPKLELAYTSSGRNSPFGMGWAMSGLPVIGLNLQSGFPKYDGTEQYTFAGQELLPWLIQEEGEWQARTAESDDFHIAYYRSKTEGGFTRFEKCTHKTEGTIHWRIRTPANQTMLFGIASDGSSQIQNPMNPEQVFIWQLDAQYDSFGNVIRFEYKTEDDTRISRTSIYERHRFLDTPRFAQKYLKRIRYGNSRPEMPDTPVPANQHWAFEVILDYGEHVTAGIPSYEPVQNWLVRDDAYSIYGPGYEVRTYRLCRRVLMFHHFNEIQEAPTLVGNFEIDHLEQPTGSIIRAFSYTAYRYDHGEYSFKTLPSLNFTYTTVGLADSFLEADERSVQNAPLGVGGLNYKWIDLYGEGLPGILYESDFAWYYKPNLGQGQLGKQERVPFKPSASFGAYSLADFDNDGNLNVVILQGREAGFYEYDRDKEQWSAFQAMPCAPQVSGNTQLMDLTGDGWADLVSVEQDRISWFPSKGKEGFGPSETISKPVSNGISRLPTLGALPMLDYFFADMTGDGLPDQVRVWNGRVEYWPNLGRGRFGEGVLMGDAPSLENGFEFDASRVRLMDLTGNGVSDLIYIGKGEIRYWLNACGNFFTEGQTISGLPYIDRLSSAQILDFLGNGTPCLVWCSPLSGHSDAPLQYLPLTNNVKPSLLVGIQNGMGRETRFDYGFSVQHYLRDKRNGMPWVSKIPMHSTVADRMEEIDLIGGQRATTRYEYHDGFYDGEERVFRGFCRVDQYDTENYTGPAEDLPAGYADPVCTRIWYHNGMPGWRDRRETHYFRGDTQAPLLQEVVIENLNAIGPEEYFDAYRVLAGQILRKEIYGLQPDGTARPVPYQISQNNFLLRRIQPSTNKEDACFAAFPLENINCSYEEVANDPRITHTVVLETDRFGQAVLTAAIAYPRRSSDLEQQRHMHVLLTSFEFEHIDLRDRYQLTVPFEQKTYELSGIVPESGRSYMSISHLAAETDRALASEIPFQQAFGAGHQSRLNNWERMYYWNNDQSAALPWQQSGAVLMVHHTEKACFNSSFLTETLGDRHDAERLEREGMYDWHDQYWWQSEPVTRHYGPERFFTARGVENRDGGLLTYEYDAYTLALVRTANFIAGEDGARLRVTAEIDYNILAPWRITDANDNISEALYDPFGIMIASTSYGEIQSASGNMERMGHAPLSDYRRIPEPSFDDLIAAPARYIQGAGSFLYYELHNWAEDRQPLRSAALARENWVYDGEGNSREESPLQVVLEYRDGFARPLQNKQQVESGPALARNSSGEILLDATGKPVLQHSETRWKVSGHVQYNNKQQAVRQFEPWFSSTPVYEPDAVLQTLGYATLMRYDAVGRQVETRFPDGSLSRVEITPWATRQFDANDTVSASDYEQRVLAMYPESSVERRALQQAAAHYNTPVTTHMDPLGRVFLTEEANENGETRRQQVEFHPSGEPARIFDARRIEAFTYFRDLNGRIWYERSTDAGSKWQFLNALDQATHLWDARGMHKQVEYDALGRITSIRVSGIPSMNHRTDRLRYGDEPGVEQAGARNARGQAVEVYDTAGILRVWRFDLMGNALDSERRIVESYTEIPDWQTPETVAMLPERFHSEFTFDALSRPVRQRLPDLVTRRFEFHPSGMLRQARVQTEDSPAGDQILLNGLVYNARGQRIRAVAGSGIVHTYAYDERSFRLTRMTARRPTQGDEPERLYQDLHYTYDAVGNITHLRDAAQETAYPLRGLQVSSEKTYIYDAFYQLRTAEGRIHQALEPNDHHHAPDAPGLIKGTRHLSFNNGAAVRRYRRTYDYDLAGNRLRMQHTTLGLGTETNRSWTREHWVSATSNRSLPLYNLHDVPITNPETRFDANGNCLYLPHLHRFEWDYRNQLARAVLIERAGDIPDDAEYYVYDGNSQRVRKVRERVVDAATGRLEIEEKIYLDGCEIKRIRSGGRLVLDRATSHLTDGTQRIALLHHWYIDRAGRETDNVSEQKYHYQLNDQIGSTSMEVNERGELIHYEEYFPYGGAAFIAGDNLRDVSLRDYRYSGKERDDSTGLYYYGYRYYAPWLGRWLSPDPIGPEDGLNLYAFVGNNPVNRVDEEGLQASESTRGHIIRSEEHLSPNDFTPEQLDQIRAHPNGYITLTPGVEGIELNIFDTRAERDDFLERWWEEHPTEDITIYGSNLVDEIMDEVRPVIEAIDIRSALNSLSGSGEITSENSEREAPIAEATSSTSTGSGSNSGTDRSETSDHTTRRGGSSAGTEGSGDHSEARRGRVGGTSSPATNHGRNTPTGHPARPAHTPPNHEGTSGPASPELVNSEMPTSNYSGPPGEYSTATDRDLSTAENILVFFGGLYWSIMNSLWEIVLMVSDVTALALEWILEAASGEELEDFQYQSGIGRLLQHSRDPLGDIIRGISAIPGQIANNIRQGNFFELGRQTGDIVQLLLGGYGLVRTGVSLARTAVNVGRSASRGLLSLTGAGEEINSVSAVSGATSDIEGLASMADSVFMRDLLQKFPADELESLAEEIRNLPEGSAPRIASPEEVVERLGNRPDIGALYEPKSGSPGTIFLRNNPTRVEVIEEVLHYLQHQQAGWRLPSEVGSSVAQWEVSAQNFMIRYSSRLGFDSLDVEAITKNLFGWLRRARGE